MFPDQGGLGWMAVRPWRFASTSLCVVVNVRSAQYFNTPQLIELHAEAKKIIQLDPTTDITLDNVVNLEDDTLLSQKSGLHAVLSTNKQKAKHSNYTPQYWLKIFQNRNKMVDKCINHGIGTFRNDLVFNGIITDKARLHMHFCIDDYPSATAGSRKDFTGILSPTLPAECREPRRQRFWERSSWRSEP